MECCANSKSLRWSVHRRWFPSVCQKNWLTKVRINWSIYTYCVYEPLFERNIKRLRFFSDSVTRCGFIISCKISHIQHLSFLFHCKIFIIHPYYIAQMNCNPKNTKLGWSIKNLQWTDASEDRSMGKLHPGLCCCDQIESQYDDSAKLTFLNYNLFGDLWK